MPFLKTVAAAASIAVAALAFTPSAQAGSEDAIIAGAAGFAVGALVGSAAAGPHYVPPRAYYAPRAQYVPRRAYVAPVTYKPVPWTPAWYAYCAEKYRSFDPRTGTFLGYDGDRHMCR